VIARLREVAGAESLPLRAFCVRILECGDLESKLTAPGELAAEGADLRIGPPVDVARPVRDPGLEMTGSSSKLPALRALGSRDARATCMARFAHHELMAVELFAWALLRWPELPDALKRGLVLTLAEEQIHCRLYLGRLGVLGRTLGEYGHSDYFWRHARTIVESPHGVRAFLAAMGLTLEQANLDFTLLYRDAFFEVGDEASAQVCQRVHDDEIRHVRLAAEWLERLDEDSETMTGAYEAAVPFPLAAHRAKGRRFDALARRRAGLDDEFIEYVRLARSTQEAKPASDSKRS
jgi:uncharacterized ferritin-like protein (DUF455 family)